MKRFFAFGCSFTNYGWPTWADLLGEQFAHYENWGKVGAGNFYIANSIVECHRRKQITADDVVCIMWSSMTREDRYMSPGQWCTPGTIYSQDKYDADWVRQWFNLRGAAIRDLHMIYTTKILLDSIGCDYHMMSIIGFSSNDQSPITLLDNADVKTSNITLDDIDDLLESYQDTLSIIKPSVLDVVYDGDWSNRPLWQKIGLAEIERQYHSVAGPDWPSFDDFYHGRYQKITSQHVIQELQDTNRWNWSKKFQWAQRPDPHPTPDEHLMYLDAVLPQYPIDSSTRTKVNIMGNKIRNRRDLHQRIYDESWMLTKPKQPITRW
jgi:hypothetical protein